MNINCEMAHDLLPMYKDKCLSASSETALREHLAVCPECRRYLHEYKARERDNVLIPSGDFSAVSKRLRRHRTVTELAIGSAVAVLTVYALIKTIKS